MKFILAILVFALFAVTPGFAGTDLYVNTSPTESTCSLGSLVKGYFKADSFSFSGSSDSSSLKGTSQTGKISLQNLIIGKGFDNCSGILITQFLQDRTIPTVTMIETENDQKGGLNIILKITLTNARIAAYSLGGGTSVPLESFSFAYDKACIASTIPGTPEVKSVTTTVCYDPSTNTVN